MYCYPWMHADRIQAGTHSSVAECKQQDINNPAARGWKQTLHVVIYTHRMPINTRVLQCVKVSWSLNLSPAENSFYALHPLHCTASCLCRGSTKEFIFLRKMLIFTLMFTASAASDRQEINREMHWDDDIPDMILKLSAQSLLLRKYKNPQDRVVVNTQV